MLLVGCASTGAATEEERVKDTINGLFDAYNAENYEKCLTYLADVPEAAEEATIAGLEMARELAGELTVEKIENVTVDGSTATAKVTIGAQGQTQAMDLTLTKHDGSWKMSTEALAGV
jgi:uncharacterized protein YerC